MGKNSLPGACLEQMGFMPCMMPDDMNPMGQCFAPSPELGKGHYWYYEREGLFAIGITDITLYEDEIMVFDEPEYVALEWWETISADELSPYKRITANTLRGHVSSSAPFRARYHKNIPIRGIELMVMPGYYRDYISSLYPGEFSDPISAFRSIDGMTCFPEMMLLMRQIMTYRGTGISAHLFYESKIAEALSLIIEKTKGEKNEKVAEPRLTDEDRKNLEAVKSWIDDHAAWEIKTEQLASIACMGQTKLRYSFKRFCGSTITEYIQSKRIANAEYMLSETDLTISQIAEAVGYHHAGRFASLYKKYTGLSPDEYRSLNRKNKMA